MHTKRCDTFASIKDYPYCIHTRGFCHTDNNTPARCTGVYRITEMIDYNLAQAL